MLLMLLQLAQHAATTRAAIQQFCLGGRDGFWSRRWSVAKVALPRFAPRFLRIRFGLLAPKRRRLTLPGALQLRQLFLQALVLFLRALKQLLQPQHQFN